jgi:hypothetical protein
VAVGAAVVCGAVAGEVAAGAVVGAAAGEGEDGAIGARGMAAAGVIVVAGVVGVTGGPGPTVPIAAFMADGDGLVTPMAMAMAIPAAPMVGAILGHVPTGMDMDMVAPS